MEISEEDFRAAVQAYLDIANILPGDPIKALAVEFEVAPTTVKRWAKGTARPHPLLRKQVIKWIQEQT